MEIYNAEDLATKFAAIIIKNDPAKIIQNRETAADDIANFINHLSHRFSNELQVTRINLSD